MPSSLFVTGLSGFVGGHIRELFSGGSFPAYDLTLPQQGYDLLCPGELEECINNARPEFVIHLAGQTFVPRSFEYPEETLSINLLGTLHLLQALKKSGFSGRMLYVSSGDVYGPVPSEELPIQEVRPVSPRNPYSVSKASAELLCQQWSAAENMDIVIARPFNHVGRGQSDRFVVSSMAKQIARMKLGKAATQLSVGNIGVTRDFLHVEDVISAYIQLLDMGRSREIYNICSGVEVEIKNIIERLSYLSGVDFEINSDTSRKRHIDQPRVRGDNRKLLADTNWQSKKSLDDMLEDVLNYWLEQES